MSSATPTRRLVLYPTFRGWWIVGVSFLALFTHGAATSYLFGLLVVPMENDLGWSRTMLTGALTVATFVSAGLGMVLGPLFDRSGARLGMTLSALFGGACLLLLAFTDVPWAYYALLGVGVGAARTGLEIVGPRTAIANWFVRRRAAAFAWSSGGRAVFGFTMVPVFAVLIEQTSWRAGWAVLGVVEICILAPLVWLVVRRRPEDHGQLPDGDLPSAMRPEQSDRSRTVPDEDSWTLREAVRTRTLWLIVASLMLTGFPATGVIANMVPYFIDEGLDLQFASTAFAMFGFGAMLGRPFWGYIAARFGVHASLTLWGSVTPSPSRSTSWRHARDALRRGMAHRSRHRRLAAAAVAGVAGLFRTQARRRHYGPHGPARHPAMALGPLVTAAAFDLTGSYEPIHTVYVVGAFFAGFFFLAARRPRRKALSSTPPG